MIAELEDTSARRKDRPGLLRSDTSILQGQTSTTWEDPSSEVFKPRGAKRHSLPTVVDEEFRRQMRTWHFDEPTQTWRPQESKSLRSGGARSFPNLAEHLDHGDGLMRTPKEAAEDCNLVLLAELSTNLVVRNQAIQDLYRHLAKTFPETSNNTIVSVHRPHSLVLNGSPGPCSVLKIHALWKSSGSTAIERRIRSTRLVLANLLGLPVGCTFVVGISFNKPSATGYDHNYGNMVVEREDGRAHLASANAKSGKGRLGDANVYRRISMPQLSKSPGVTSHSMAGRGTSFLSTPQSRSSLRVGPISRVESEGKRSPTGAAAPFPRCTGARSVHRQQFSTEIYGCQDTSGHGRTTSTTGPRGRNILQKRSIEASTEAFSQRGAHRHIENSTKAKRGHRSHGSLSSGSPKPARMTRLTTSRMSWTGTARCKVPDHLDAISGHSLRATRRHTELSSNGSQSTGDEQKAGPAAKADSILNDGTAGSVRPVSLAPSPTQRRGVSKRLKEFLTGRF